MPDPIIIGGPNDSDDPYPTNIPTPGIPAPGSTPTIPGYPGGVPPPSPEIQERINSDPQLAMLYNTWKRTKREQDRVAMATYYQSKYGANAGQTAPAQQPEGIPEGVMVPPSGTPQNAPAQTGGTTPTPAAGGSTGSGGESGGFQDMLQKWLGVAGKLAPVVSQAAGSQAAGERADDRTDLERDRINLTAFQTNLAAPGRRLDTSLKASRTANAQPVKMNWSGPGSGLKPGGGFNITGGYNNPDIIGPDTRQTADDITAQMLQEQLARDKAPNASPSTVGEGVGDKILGTAGTVLSGLDAFNAVMGRNKQPQTPMPSGPQYPTTDPNKYYDDLELELGPY